MSRIDEALRRAVGTGRLPDDRYRGAAAEPRAHAVDVETLERYAVERPARLQGSVQPRTAHSVVAPRADGRRRPIAFPPALDGRLVVSPNIEPVVVEQYRRLAAVLHDLQVQRGLKILMVSSATPGEGKTLTVSNLALTLSESYSQRVLLIDADLRRPSVHEVFGIPNRRGLADAVREGVGSVPLVEVSPCLSVLTAGGPMASPLAMLTSDRVRGVVSDAAARFEWVLLDTPPCGLLPDAQLVARLSEGVLFVIAAGATPYALVKRSIAELGADRIVGTVLNRVKRWTLAENDHYGHYYAAAGSRPR